MDGDPAAPERLATLGLDGVVLAAAYHAVRAATRSHPGHRVVTRDAAVYFRPDPGRWARSALRPVAAEPGDSFGRAAESLRAAGIPVTAWVVLTHNGRIGAAAPGHVVRNAFGDAYRGLVRRVPGRAGVLRDGGG